MHCTGSGRNPSHSLPYIWRYMAPFACRVQACQPRCSRADCDWGGGWGHRQQDRYRAGGGLGSRGCLMAAPHFGCNTRMRTWDSCTAIHQPCVQSRLSSMHPQRQRQQAAVVHCMCRPPAQELGCHMRCWVGMQLSAIDVIACAMCDTAVLCATSDRLWLCGRFLCSTAEGR
jgi:hypothetical protein